PGVSAARHMSNESPSMPAPTALLNLEIDRREMLMVAIRVRGMDAEQVEPRLLDLASHARADAGFRLEVEREAAFGHGLVEIGQRFLLRLLDAGDEVGHGDVLDIAVRIGVGEKELEDERLIDLGLEKRPRLDAARRRLLVGVRFGLILGFS